VNTVHDTTNAAKDKAAEVGSQVSDKAKGQVDTRTTQAGDQLQDKAEGLHQMGDQLRDSGQDAFAQLADKVAGFTESAAQYLRTADADSLMGDVERIARRQPWAVAAGGMFLGFAASRIVKAGTDRRTGGQSSMGRYSAGSGGDIDLTRGYPAGTGAGYSTESAGLSSGYAAGTSTGYGQDYDNDYATGTGTTGDLPSGYEPLSGGDPLTDPAPLGDPYSTQPGGYTDGNR